MNYAGILIGGGAFFIIGILHPVVIKGEYYFGKRIWPIFFVVGMLAAFFSLQFQNIVLSALFGVIGFSLFWSIHEIFEQERRVEKGWYPANPKRALEKKQSEM